MPGPLQSIRWRFALWLAFLLTVVLAAFGLTAYRLHDNNQFAQLDEELKQRVAIVAAVIRSPPLSERGPRNFGPGDRDWPGGFPRRFPPDNAPDGPPDFKSDENSTRQKFARSPDLARLFFDHSTNGFYYAAWTRAFGNREYNQSTNAPAAIPQPERQGFAGGSYPRQRGAYREIFYFTERGDCVLVGKAVLTEQEATRRFAFWLALGGLAVLTLGVAGIWLLAGRALKPVHEISAAATRISAGNLAERINVSATDDELGELAQTLNSTFSRLADSFARQQQFTADASHELRTPLAVMISEAQTTLARPRTEAEYRETIEICLATAQQMRRLTETLLELARYDSGLENPPLSPVDLATIAAAAVKLVRPLAVERQLEILVDFSPAPTSGNADRLAQVIVNLLANAIEYSRPGGNINVTTRAGEKEVSLTVQDFGAGIAAEELPHIFKRFHRTDKSRARANGHSGLGLAICQSIVAAHGGSLTVTSQLGAGATFTLCLPTASPSSHST